MKPRWGAIAVMTVGLAGVVSLALRIWIWDIDREAASLPVRDPFDSPPLRKQPPPVFRDPAKLSVVYSTLPTAARAAFSLLLNAEEFSGAVDDSRVERPNTTAFNTLLYDSQAAVAFKELTESASSWGQLYGLCGLYFVDRPTLEQVLPRFTDNVTPIELLFSDVVSEVPFSELVGKPPVLAPPVLTEPLEPMPALTVAAGGLCILICRPPCAAAQQPNSALQPPDTPGTPPAKQASRQAAGG
jgi:hypothetical protein